MNHSKFLSAILGFLFCLASPGHEEGPGHLAHGLHERLEKDGFVVTDKTYRQGFSAYIRGQYPAFITSDSLLMTYVSLLEKVVSEKHLSHFGAQVDLIVEMAKHLPEASSPKKGAKEVRLLIGCAHRILLGNSPTGMSGEETELIELEAVRVEKAEGLGPPKWWGANDYLPYSRFVPTSTWDQTESLRRYFRYYQWMQSLELDGANQLHLEMAEVLYHLIEEIDFMVRNFALSSFYPDTKAAGVLVGLNEIGYGKESPALKEEVRLILAQSGQLIAPKPTSDKAFIDEQLARLRDLSRVTASVGKALGSALPRVDEDPLPESDWVSDEIYLKALTKLNGKPDERAPKLFHSEAWQRKQLNCTMAGWAEWRHAVAITQTTSASWMGMFREDPGYVEPVPDFFQTLGLAAERLAGESLGLQREKERFRAFLFALKLEMVVKDLRQIKGDEEVSFFPKVAQVYSKHEGALKEMFPKIADENDSGEWEVATEKNRKKLIQEIEAACRKFRAQDPKVKQQFERHATRSFDDTTPRVFRLALLSLRLERLARRQLAGLKRTEEEIQFIKDYGKILGNLMFYEGNSYLTPRDDAPKIVSIAHLGQPGAEKVLQCGTARPRRLLIHYPNREGKLVLCEGAVYAYRERIAEKPVSDVEWRGLCKTSSSPVWLAPFAQDLPQK